MPVRKPARELFTHGTLRRVRRAEGATRPAVELLTQITREAAATGTRRLVLLSGVPGAGKTLVGLQLVHAHWLDDLSVERGGGKPAAPAVFLSGNGPLVDVLQYELRGAGGGGKVFVRGVKDYVKRYLGRDALVPPEHVLVFDEAQRAYSREMVAAKHKIPVESAESEPELFVRIAERIPRWCVVLGLIGGGQEIHKGEEDGIAAWRKAIESSPGASEWSVHCPPAMARAFEGWGQVQTHPQLSLDQELRFHLTRDVHLLVAKLLDASPARENRPLAERLEADGFHLRVTRDLAVARQYLRDRFAEDPERRFGIVASSRDKDLTRFRIYNDFQSTKRIRFGPWYGASEDDPSEASCRLLRDCVTEFGAQGLELDGALVAWGTDLRMREGRWDMSKARSYARDAVPLRDPGQLRLNSYRVLLTRGREGSVIFVPPLDELDETASYFTESGIRSLDR
ncbi:MAG: DNA/RNA helicase domain-containing protein [Phycisphaerales bacterium]